MSCKVGTQCLLKQETVNELEKTVEVILSDETKIERYSWEGGEYLLSLSHEESAVDLTRAEILSLFINHNTYELPIGRFKNVRLEDRKLKATAVFDEDDDESMKIFKKLSKGFLQSFSIGATINDKVLEREENGIKHYKATSWSLNEASVVGIPAIPNAKVSLSMTEANPTASGDNSKKNNIGADMKFDKENLEETEATFKALVLNRDTLTSRNNSLELQLQTSQTALVTKTEELSAIKAEMTSKVSEAEGKLESFKQVVEARLAEASTSKIGADMALAMVKATSDEEASKIALEAKSNTEALKQAESLSTQKGAWDDFKKGDK